MMWQILPVCIYGTYVPVQHLLLVHDDRQSIHLGLQSQLLFVPPPPVCRRPNDAQPFSPYRFWAAAAASCAPSATASWASRRTWRWRETTSRWRWPTPATTGSGYTPSTGDRGSGSSECRAGGTGSSRLLIWSSFLKCKLVISVFTSLLF